MDGNGCQKPSHLSRRHPSVLGGSERCLAYLQISELINPFVMTFNSPDFKYVELVCCLLFDKRISLGDGRVRKGQVSKFCTCAKSRAPAPNHRKMSVKLKTEALTLRSLREIYAKAEVNAWFNDSTTHMHRCTCKAISALQELPVQEEK